MPRTKETEETQEQITPPEKKTPLSSKEYVFNGTETEYQAVKNELKYGRPVFCPISKELLTNLNAKAIAYDEKKFIINKNIPREQIDKFKENNQ